MLAGSLLEYRYQNLPGQVVVTTVMVLVVPGFTGVWVVVDFTGVVVE
jgi:hypothetical protein